MRIVAATIYALHIPFAEAFRHSAQERGFSDSIIVRLRTADGTHGFGEGVARPFVTGEAVETSIAHIVHHLWPSIARSEYPDLGSGSDPVESLIPIDRSLPDLQTPGVIAWNAARAAVELALVDCLLRQQNLSLTSLLPPRRSAITYSGVLTCGSIQRAVQHARYFKLFGLRQIKIKLDGKDDCKRVNAIRRVVGPETSLRVDANGVYDLARAPAALDCLSQFNIATAEQPIRRGHPLELAQVKRASRIPIMADESIVTLEDGHGLLAANACDYLNLRISKCGGLSRTLQLARLAQSAGLGLQVGSQVGETAILSAVGRHVAAYLDDPSFVEGSYGQLLLVEDIARDGICFGHGGRAPLLKGLGLGVEVREEILRKYARTIITLEAT